MNKAIGCGLVAFQLLHLSSTFFIFSGTVLWFAPRLALSCVVVDGITEFQVHSQTDGL